MQVSYDNVNVEEVIAASRVYQEDLQLNDICKPGPNDVLCGRGGGSQNHIGNKEYRSVIASNKRLYIESSRRMKTLLVESIVNAVRLQNPPGRFLEMDVATGLWKDIGDKRAFAKTCQAIREGAPKIREEIVCGVKPQVDVPKVECPLVEASPIPRTLQGIGLDPCKVAMTPNTIFLEGNCSELNKTFHEAGNVVTPLNLSGHDVVDGNLNNGDDVTDVSSSLMFPAVMLNENEIMNMPLVDFIDADDDTIEVDNQELLLSLTEEYPRNDDETLVTVPITDSPDLDEFLNEWVSNDDGEMEL